jgi:hypothetical protein
MRRPLLATDGYMSNYLDSVEDIAKEAKQEYPNPRLHHDQRAEWITESVDGSAWIIYDAKNEEVLRQTENEPDGSEVREMAGPDADWRKMRQIAAFMAMEADVHEALRELDEAGDEEEDEGTRAESERRQARRKRGLFPE